MTKEKIIIFTQDDNFFTKNVVQKIIDYIQKDYEIDIFIEKKQKKNLLKYLSVFFLFSNLSELVTVFLKNKKNKYKNANYVNKILQDYSFGISYNYPKKIKLKNFKIYNFHLGNFNNQRGIFIFFYKFFFNWENIDLTFHEINNNFDDGIILENKSIDVTKSSSISICNLYLSNLNFIYSCLDNIKKGNFSKNIKIIDGKYNTAPSYYKIIKTFIKYDKNF